MQYSSDDMLALVAELNCRRIGMVLHKRKKRMRQVLILPGNVPDQTLSLHEINMLAMARKLHQRFLAGRYFHEPDELSTIKDLCYWLINEHQTNEGFPQRTGFMFNESAMAATMPPPNGKYLGYCKNVGQNG